MKWDFLKSREFKIFLTIWIVYIFFISGYGGNWMADSTLSEALSLANNYTFAADTYVKEGCEEVGCGYAFFNGHFYSGEPPGSTFLAVPVLFIFRPMFMMLPSSLGGYSASYLGLVLANILATVFIASLFGALLSVLVYHFSGYFTRRRKVRLLLAFSFAFGTFFFVYSTEYSARVIASFFSFYAFYLLFKNKHFGISQRSLFFAGLYSGMAVLIDYSQVVVVLLLVVYLFTFLRTKKSLYFLFGGFLMFIVLISYHYAIYENPFTTPYAHHIYWEDKQVLNSGFYSMVHPTFESVWGLTFGIEKGLFSYMPITLLSLFGIYLILRERQHKYFIEFLVVLLIFLIVFLHNSSLTGYDSWKGNCGFGPRYLTVVIPFLMLPLALAYEKVGLKVSAIFAGVSVFINFLPVLYGKTVLWQSFVGVGCNSPNVLFREYIPLLFERGLTNYTLNLIKYKIYDLPVYIMNLATIVCLVIIGIIIWAIWKRDS